MSLLDTVRTAAGYIHKHYCDELTVKQIGEFVHLSPSYLGTVFRVLSGYTLMDYLSRYRLYLAAVSLRETNTPVIDIAFECGFRSQQAFTRSFTRTYGMPPMRFRKLGIEACPFPASDIFEKRSISMHLKKAFDDVQFVQKDSFLVVGVENDVYYDTGYGAINRCFQRWNDEKLIDRIEHQVYDGICYGITHESLVDNMSKYIACVEVSSLENLPSGLVARRFDASEYAVFEIPLASEGDFWRYFYHTWLKETGYRQPGMITTKSNYPLPILPNFEVYDKSFVDDSSMVKIYAPIQR